MESQFWLDRWEADQIGFHEAEGNSKLPQFWSTQNKGQQEICVPLCGKTLDLRYLSNFGHVTGFELSPIAIRDFFREWSVTPVESDRFGLRCLSARGVSLIEADFLALPTAFYESFTHIYDRAAMIALPPRLRGSYTQQIHRLLARGGEALVLTIEYPNGEIPGPPFSIDPIEIERFYRDGFEIAHLETENIWRSDSRLVQEGITALSSHIFRLTRLSD